MNENPSSPDRDSASSPQRYQGDSSLLRRGLQHLSSLEGPSSRSELAVGSSEPPLLWSFAAYSCELEDVVARRPSASLVISENVPDELKERRQWICWEWAYWERWRSRKHREQGWSECPISPITGGGNWNTSDKWGSFAEASAFTDFDGLAGIAFVISEEDPYVVADLTNCRDPVSGALHPVATRVVSALGSYAEVSPSGNGIHAVVRGNLSPPLEVLSEDPFEDLYIWPQMRDRDWFLPMTGHRVPDTLREIQDRGEELLRLQQFDSERLLSRRSPSTESAALIKECRIVDRAVVVTIDPGIDVCLEARTGKRIHDVVIPPDPSSDIYTTSGICIQYADYVDFGPCVLATDSLTENELWCFPPEDDPESSSPKNCSVEVKDEIVYVGIDQELFALHERSGEILWHFGESFVKLSEVADGIAYLHVVDGIRALDVRTGKEVWHLATGGPITASFLVGSRIYIGEGGSNINGVDAITGTVDDGSSICCIDAFTGTVQWKVRTFERGRPFAVQNGVVALRGSSFLGAINAETGEVLWEKESKHPWSSFDYSLGGSGQTVAVAGSIIYAGAVGGRAIALELATGRELWRFDIGDPVRSVDVTDDAVFVTGQHVLYALRHV